MEKTAEALKRNGMEVFVVENGAAAKAKVMEMVPVGYEYVLPLEDARAQKVYGMGSNVSKILIVNKEIAPQRITVILVKEKLGF